VSTSTLSASLVVKQWTFHNQGPVIIAVNDLNFMKL